MVDRRSFLRRCLGSLAAVAMVVYVPRFVIEEKTIDACSVCENGFWNYTELPANQMCTNNLHRMFDKISVYRPPEPLIVTYDEYVRLGGKS